MSIEEIKEIILAVLAPLGGVTGLVTIVVSIAKMVAAAKSGAASAKYTKSLSEAKSEIIGELRDNLNCSFDIDISAKLNSVLEKLERQYLEKAQGIDEKLEVMRELSVESTRLLSTSRKITEEQRAQLNALIQRAEAVVVAPEAEAKPTVTISLGTNAGSDGTTTAAGAKSSKAKLVV